MLNSVCRFPALHDPLPADLADAQALLGPHTRFVARGSTCVVFTDTVQVVRLALTDEARLTSQLGVQQALANRLQLRLVARAFAIGHLPDGRPYILEELVKGDDEPMTLEGWRDVGQVLQGLHSLPHQGYGLLQDLPAIFVGAASTPQAGLLSRLHAVWPFDKSPLAEHPLLHQAPELAGPLQGLDIALREVIHAPTAICHTDLHANQFITRGGRLAALLDFGDATIAPPAWDIASVAFFHGWEVAGIVAEAAGLPCGRDAALFGLLLAFHRAARAQELEQAGRLAQAGAFARGCVARLD